MISWIDDDSSSTEVATACAPGGARPEAAGTAVTWRMASSAVADVEVDEDQISEAEAD